MTQPRQFATRCHQVNSFNSGATSTRCRRAHIARGAINNLPVTVVFPNWYHGAAQNEQLAPGTATLSAAIEKSDGTFKRLTFGGAGTATLAAGAGGLVTSGNVGLAHFVSDPVNLSFADGEVFWVRSLYSNASGSLSLVGTGDLAPVQDNANFGEVLEQGSGLADNTMGGPYGTNVAGAVYGPVVIAAPVTTPAPFLLGDSRTMGTGDTADGSGDLGNLARPLGASMGYSKFAEGGYRANYCVASDVAKCALFPYFTHLCCELGFNDVDALGSTALQALSDLQTIWGQATAAGLIVVQSTLEPHTSSPDAWATFGNQVLATHGPVFSNAYRVQLNNLIRAKPSGVSIVVEAADIAEDSRDSGLWKVGGYTADGIHGTMRTYLLGAAKLGNFLKP